MLERILFKVYRSMMLSIILSESEDHIKRL